MSGPWSLTSWLSQLALAPFAVAVMLKVTLILASSWLVHLMLARANPRWRTLLWRATVVALLAVPVLHCWGPAVNLSILTEASTIPLARGGESIMGDARLERDSHAAENASVRPSSSSEHEATLHPQSSAGRAEVQSSRADPFSGIGVLRTVQFVWSVGFLLLLARLGVGVSRVVRIVRNAAPVPKLVMREFRRVCDELGYRKALDVRCSREVKSPLLCGLLRPVLILPDCVCGQGHGSDHLSAILAHELSHARSHDTFWNTMLHVSGIVLWFHPLAWRMRRAHAAACEAVSDCVAADFVGDIDVYGRVLARVTLDSAQRMPLAALAMGHRCDVSRRVSALRRRVFAGGLGWRRIAGALATGTLLITLVAGLRVVLLETPVSAGEEQTHEKKKQKSQSPERLAVNIDNLKDIQAAVAKGLHYLASQQNDDGSFGKGVRTSGNVGIASLAGLALLGAGNKPGKGGFADNIQAVVEYLLASSREDGLIRSPDATSHGVMYEHAYATRFLAEVYPRERDERILKALANAVMLIVDSQNEEGGWRYLPTSTDADISVTSSQIIALQAAKKVGVAVPKKTLDRAIEYVKRCQNTDGGFAYMAERGESGLPRSAAAMTALFMSGVKEKAVLTKGVGYIMSQLPSAQDKERRESYFFYSRYYAVEAAFHAGASEWSQWYKEARDELLHRQKLNGSWHHPLGPVYATALASLSLQTSPFPQNAHTLPQLAPLPGEALRLHIIEANEWVRPRWLQIEMGMKADALERANPIGPSRLRLPNEIERIAPSRVEPRDR